MARVGWALLALLLTVQGAASQGEAGAEGSLSGTLNLSSPLVVEAGRTVVLQPGTLLTGTSGVVVHGTLDARGSPDAPVRITVPVRVEGGTLLARHASVWGVPGVALDVAYGNVTLEEVVVYANRAGLDARDANVTLRNVTFREHEGAALRLRGSAPAHATALRFFANGQNAVVEPGPGASFALADSHLSAPTTRGASLAILSTLQADERALVRTQRNAFDGGDVGIRVEGPGVRLESADDAFLGTRIGLVLEDGEADLTRARFEAQEQAFETGERARISLTDPRFAPVAASAPAPAPAGPGMGAVWLGALGLVALAGTIAWARARFRSAPHAGPDALEAPPPEPVRLGILSEVERRVLLDVLANAGTPQAAVAQRLGMTRQALHYHVKKLEARGLLAKEARGRETLCRVPPPVAAALRESVSVTPGTHPEALEKA